MRGFAKTFVAVVLPIILLGCDAVEDKPEIGMAHRLIFDDSRENWLSDGARPIAMTLWYPAQSQALSRDILVPEDDPIFQMGRAAPGAMLLDQEKRPLVVLSHGTGGSALQMMWLGEALAKQGYITVALSHHGNTAAEPRYDPRGFLFFWERAKDVSFALDMLFQDDIFGPVIDQKRIGAVGFSLGGYTVAALAGARLDLNQFEEFCKSESADATCAPQLEYKDVFKDFETLVAQEPRWGREVENHEGDFSDPRINVFAAIAPALGRAMTQESLMQIFRPFSIIVGGLDEVAPGATNASYMAQHIPQVRLTEIMDAGHYSFLALCTDKGRIFVPVCKEKGGQSRQELHDQAIAEVQASLYQGFLFAEP